MKTLAYWLLNPTPENAHLRKSMNLDQLAKHYGTDKASTHPTGAHDYARRYEPIFEALKDSIQGRPAKIIEIGVGSGGCLRMWLDLFSTMDHRAEVIGVDNNETAIINIQAQNFPLKLAFGDASRGEFWLSFCRQFGSGFDLIIDDGSHYSSDIIQTFDFVWPLLNPGGLYVCEDLHCSYNAAPFNPTPPIQPSVEFFKTRIDVMNDHGAGLTGMQMDGNYFDWIHFSKSFVVIKKR